MSNHKYQTFLYRLLVILLMLCGTQAKAQTRFVESASIGLEQGLGYTIPTVDLITGVEQPIHKRWEIDAEGAYGFTHKADQPLYGFRPNGHTVILDATPIFWVKPWFGVTGAAGVNWLHTMAYSKFGYSHFPTPGIVFRAHPLGIPSRLWLSGDIPVASIDRKTGIESNQISGVNFSWEGRMGHIGAADIRLMVTADVYQGYNQGNPICDGTDGGPVTCQRSSWLTLIDVTTVRFVFPRDKNEGEW